MLGPGQLGTSWERRFPEIPYRLLLLQVGEVLLVDGPKLL